MKKVVNTFRPQLPNGDYWNPADEAALWAAFKQEVKAELDARNAARGVPNGMRLAMNDPRAHLRYDGDELHDRVEQKKIDFCSKPRDPKTELAKYGLTPAFVPPDKVPPINPMLAVVIRDAVTEAMAPFVETMREFLRTDGTPNRRGRPRRLATVENESE